MKIESSSLISRFKDNPALSILIVLLGCFGVLIAVMIYIFLRDAKQDAEHERHVAELRAYLPLNGPLP